MCRVTSCVEPAADLSDKRTTAEPSIEAPAADVFTLDNRITGFINRHARAMFVLVTLLYLISFNGQWRVGLDSSNYRGLGDSIASGRGYTFGEWAPKNIYPGLPLLFAGLQSAFGRSAVAPCVAMLAISTLTMFVTYRLIRLHYAKWFAVTVTCGLATNHWYLQQTSELMTDVPFLLGVVTALYGWDRLFRAERAGTWLSAGLLLIGLAIAASMRPTLFLLVGAMGVVSLAGLMMGPRRVVHASVLGAMLLVLVVFVALDPRGRASLALGGYEREAVELLRGLVSTGDAQDPLDAPIELLKRALFVLNDQLPAGFFGEQLSLFSVRVAGLKISPTSILGSLILIAALLLIVRRHPLWALLAWVTVLATVIASAEPRYYVMILPMLLVAWLAMLVKLARKLPRPWDEVLLVGGLALVTLNNLSASVSFVKEQRSVPFLKHYKYDRKVKTGEWMVSLQMAELIAKHLPPGARVIGPSGSVLSYVSGRHVYTQRELLPRRGHVQRFPQIIADKNIEYAIFPAPHYRQKEPAVARLMERGVLRPAGPTIAEVAEMRLARLRVLVPEGDWQKLPKLYGSEVLHTP
jgi:hypothetical protein